MACFSPLQAYQLFDGSVVFSERGDVVRQLQLPCGQCVGCRLERSRQWAIRCIHEASLHKDNCFITLTYDDKHAPSDGGLHYRDFQLFMKRLRNFTRKSVRFYMCGEYGSNFGRPHFHAILFGHSFADLVLLRRTGSDSLLFRSKQLESLWPFGFSSVGEVTFESAAYVARYVMKKVTGPGSTKHYDVVNTETGEISNRRPEFNKMSLKPGIGAGWFYKFKSDVYPHDHVIVNGQPCRPPKYYDRLFSKIDPLAFESIQHDRELLARKYFPDSTPERLAVRQEVVVARISRLKRGSFK